MDICEIVLITSESLNYEFFEANFIELLKLWCEVLIIHFGIHAYVWWHIKDPNIGEKHFFRSNWNNCPNNGEKCTVCVHPWVKCSSMFSFKNAILRELRKKNCGVYFHVLLMKCLSKCPYTKKASLPCEIPGRTPAYRFHSGQTNWLHAYIVLDRFL